MPPLLTVRAAAIVTGLCEETIRRAIRAGRLEAYRRHRATRIRPDALNAYMDSYLCPASDQISHSSNYIGGRGQSSGGRKASAGVSRLALRMRSALDRH
ncbi:helix-turn-helix domain-containing protein [Brytella acorum]|uniref:helix-turn-helix domain-containing protein n=1 Tax=Brytella acorum TaxID=2959299 RepID=UPI0038D0EDBD